MAMTTTTAMAASAATVASANGVARGSRASAHPSRPPLAGRHGWRARPGLGRRARAPSRFAAVVRASRDGDAPAGGSGDTRRLKIFSVNDGTRPPDDARRDPPDASLGNQLPRIASPERLAPGSTHASASRRGSRARSRPQSPRRIAAMRDRDADRVQTRRARPDRDPPRGDVRVRTLRFKLPKDRRGGHSSFLPRPVHLLPSVDPLDRIPALTSPSPSPSPSHRSQCTSCTTCPLCAASSRTTWNRGRNFCAPSTATSSPRRCCRRWTWARRRCPP